VASVPVKPTSEARARDSFNIIVECRRFGETVTNIHSP
jgi:hypothetical protein